MGAISIIHIFVKNAHIRVINFSLKEDNLFDFY